MTTAMNTGRVPTAASRPTRCMCAVGVVATMDKAVYVAKATCSVLLGFWIPSLFMGGLAVMVAFIMTVAWAITILALLAHEVLVGGDNG